MLYINGYHLLSWISLIGLVTLLAQEATGLRGSAVVLNAKAKAAELKEAGTAEVTAGPEAVNGTSPTNSTQTPTSKSSKLTGIPQKDYIYDPNLPRELNGHNLTDYPFYNAVPEEIVFDCDGLHDGFYASVPHKCQLYHHCLYGTRYDFLCANYTAFDQKTFICHFVSEVDCDNSPKYYIRNEALYKAASTSAPPTTTPRPLPSTTAASVVPPPQPPPPPPPLSPRRQARPRYRRPYRRRRPVYEYYYDEDYDDAEYYDDDVVQQPRRKVNRKHRPQGGGFRDDDTFRDYENPQHQGQQQTTSTEGIKPSVRPSSSQSSLAGSSVYDRPRVPPKIRRPVPINERDKYDYTQKTSDVGPAPTVEAAKDKKTQPRKQQNDDEEYYDDEDEDDYEEEQQPKFKKAKPSDYDVEPTGTGDSRRPTSSRHRLRLQNRKRPDRYEDDYEEEDERHRPRKGQRHDDYNHRSSRPRNRGKGHSRDEEAVPAERPGYISSSRSGSSGPNNRKRAQNDYPRSSGRKQQERRPVYDDEEDDEYYDDEEDEIEDDKVRRNHRPSASRHSGRRDEEYSEDTKNGKRQNNKGSGSNNPNSSSKSTPSVRFSDRNKNEDIDQGKQSSKPASKLNSNDDTDSNSKLTGSSSKNVDQQRATLTNYKTSGNDNQKHVVSLTTTTTTEKYKIEEEYEDDYEEPKPSSTAKPLEEKVSRERGDNYRQSASFKSRNRSAYESANKQEETSSTLSSEEPVKNTLNYRSTTVPSSQEQTSAYSRSPSLFRSRTTSTTEDARVVTTPITAHHRFSSTQPYDEDEDDYEEPEPPKSNNRFKVDGKSRTGTPTTIANNFRKQSSTTPIIVDKSEESIKDSKSSKDPTFMYGDSSEIPMKENTESPSVSVPSRPFVSLGLFRRPLKSTTSNAIETTTSFSETTPVSSQRPIAAIGYRRVVKPIESDEKLVRKEQPYFPTGLSGNFRGRTTKTTEPDRTVQPTSEIYIDEATQKPVQQTTSSTPPPPVIANNQYRKTMKPIESSTQENTYTTKNNYEDANKSPQQLSSGQNNNYRRPAIVSRPVVEDYPLEYDDAPRAIQITQSAPGFNYRRPIKTQKVQDNQAVTENSQTDYTDSSATSAPPSAIGNGFRRPIEVPVKNEGSTIVNLRSHYGFFNPNRPKQTADDSVPTGPENVSYIGRLPIKNNGEKPESVSFPRQPPRNYDLTAPGPSAPEDAQQGNSRNNFRPIQYNEPQNPPTGFGLDIPEEEYDVTLNDALQPSTLHPTRSLADYPHQTRIKARGYQSSVTHPSALTNVRGPASFLLPSASQQYVSRVQTVRSQDKAADSDRSQNKDSQPSADQEEYEAVVLSAPQYNTGTLHRWVSQRQSRPTEWYW